VRNPAAATGIEEGAVAGVVLASGMSRRFSGENKLLVQVEGIALVRRTVEAYIAGGLQPVLVVMGYEAERVESTLSGLAITKLSNPDFRKGQSRALVRGVRALSTDVRAAVIGVGDQPYLTGEVIGRLIERYREGGVRTVVPRYGGEKGGPVLFDRSLFEELLDVSGDKGGRGVVLRHKDAIGWVDIADRAAAADIDTREDYERLTGGEA
jgi:molybdenum cofactor cytidylyltransferase